MKIKDLVKDLSQYNGEAEIYFKLVTNEDDANLDSDISYLGGICTGSVDDENPTIEIGFKE